MKKGISVQAYNRPEELNQCLEHISNLDGVCDWEVQGFVDGVGDSECREIMVNSEIVDYATFHTSNLGLRNANKKTFELMFEEYDYDLVTHVEEDILVAEESLEFIEWSTQFYDEDCQVTTLWTHPNANKVGNKAHKARRFSCWGWATTKQFYDNHMKEALRDDGPYRGDYEGWAGSVSDYMNDHNLKEIFPEMRRVRNIGFNSGVHETGPNKHRLAGQLDAWTGENFPNNTNFEMCEKEYCNIAKEHESK